jgi:hypothetical protein
MLCTCFTQVLFTDITLRFAKANVVLVAVILISGSPDLVLLLVSNLGAVKF